MEIHPTLLKDLTDKIYAAYRHDLENYNQQYFARCVKRTMQDSGIKKFDSFLHSIITDDELFKKLVENLSVKVTAMFRDPPVFRYMRENVIPMLATYPNIRIWSAGTASGEEAWSMAILLHEENLYDRSLIYATDFNPIVLEQAQQGAFPIDKMREYTSNYIAAGGKAAFSKYYRTNRYQAFIEPSLGKNIVFSTHNLITDGIFNEFHLILCRNVLIYFNNDLITKVLNLFNSSLSDRCYLCLGTHESIRFQAGGRYFDGICEKYHIFRKL